MMDLRPVGYVIGLLVAILAATMVAPMFVDLVAGRAEWETFLNTAILTGVAGGALALSCANGRHSPFTIRLSFLLTTGVWFILPVFGALPFILGSPGLSLVDALFEAASGLTTTGTTIIADLDTLSYGMHLWRAILQWLGGLGIVVVAMIFLPMLKVGGMQFFQSEGFDTFGKALPRAIDIARGLVNIYVSLTILCGMAYMIAGMSIGDAVVHAFTTIATGGFSTSNDSFASWNAASQYTGIAFMIIAGLPFVRLIQLLQGTAQPLFRDAQVRAYLTWTLYAVALIVVYRVSRTGSFSEEMVRSTLFNTVSIFTGTGYGDGDVSLWGSFPLAILFCVGAIGACSGSTGCSIKVFRYQIALRAIGAQLMRMHSPRRIVPVKYDGRVVSPEVTDSIMLLFTCFIISFGILIVGMSLSGLEFRTAVTASWTAIFNIGPAFGAEVGVTGSVHMFPDMSKWMMILAMLVGRLEIVAVLVLFLPRFWRE